MLYLFFILLNAFSVADVSSPVEKVLIRQKPTLKSKHYTLYDLDTETTLASFNEDEQVPIASITKLMSMYVVSDSLKKGYINVNDTTKVSHRAAKSGGSRMFINEGSLVSVNDLMNGAIISSGNDATIALAEHIGGNEESFVGIMNDYTKTLGLKHTHFNNSTGLDDLNHHSSSHDVTMLAAHIIKDFPDDYYRYKQKLFTYNKIKQRNRNKLLWQDDDIDGLKTGFTSKAGYCLVASAKTNNMRLIATVLGAPNESVRTEDAHALLKYGYRFFKQNSIDPSHVIHKVKVWYGNKEATLGVNKLLKYNVPIFTNQPIRADYKVNVQKLIAPIKRGTVVGTLYIKQGENILKESPLVVTNEIQKRWWILNVFDWVSLHFRSFFHKKLI